MQLPPHLRTVATTAAHVTSAGTIFTIVHAEIVLVSYLLVLGRRTSGQAQGQPPQELCWNEVLFPSRLAIEVRNSHYDAGETNTD